MTGDETLYEFGDPTGGRTEVEEREENSVSGSAQSFLLGWSPPVLDDWTFILGHARGDGDSNPDNNRDKSYRQNGLQGDSESFGELYRPELSNLAIDVIGVRWEINDGVELGLLSYDYEQRERADEMRNVSIENDTEGSSRDLGREVDLVLTIETADGLELVLTAAEFHAGSAYAGFSDETSSYFDIELIYAF